MYRKQQYSIETPENLKNLFGGQLDEENRWIEMSKMILWEEYEEEYAKNFTEKKGAPAKSLRMALGRVIASYLLQKIQTKREKYSVKKKQSSKRRKGYYLKKVSE